MFQNMIKWLESESVGLIVKLVPWLWRCAVAHRTLLVERKLVRLEKNKYTDLSPPSTTNAISHLGARAYNKPLAL